MKPVRTRVAPSPTGDPHIGTAYMALFNLAFARRHGGQFILRIEDTDQSRSTAESERAIFDSLHWLGLDYDEGPDRGGPHGPYRQSERLELYREHCTRLIESDHAYYSFATSEQLDELRRQQQTNKEPLGYRGQFDEQSHEEAKRRVEAGEPYVVRMRVPDQGDCVLHDRLRGEIRIPWRELDHQILMKSDGFPTYHLANVVDDHLMEISHVIRGEEWISSAPKHKLLYEYLGWEAPEFIHLPLLRNPDKSKLSKRKNPTSINYYRQAGYLPKAIVNFLGLMAYTLPDGREMFTLDDMIETFEIDRVSLGGPIFDLQKLAWLDGRYLREAMDVPAIIDAMQDWMLNDETWARILPMVQPRAEKLSDIIPLSAFLFTDMPAYDAELLLSKRLDGEATARLLKIALWELEKLRSWDKDSLKNCLGSVAEKEELKMRDILPPFFVAVSGQTTSLPLFDSMEILGSDMSRRRIQTALDRLTDAGFDIKGKPLKRLEKEYQEKYGTA